MQHKILLLKCTGALTELFPIDFDVTMMPGQHHYLINFKMPSTQIYFQILHFELDVVHELEDGHFIDTI